MLGLKSQSTDICNSVNTITCTCCFNDIEFDKTIQCSAGHLFCAACITYLIQTKITEGTSILQIECIGYDEKCAEFIPPAQLQIALGDNLWQKYMEKYDQENIESAILQDGSNLEQCPACKFIVEVIESKEQLKILTCPNPECRQKVCRNCHKLAHDPLTCAQVMTESGRMSGEEALTRALLRRCPNCEKKGIITEFIKYSGCNKMTCPKCKCQVCYLCEQVIKGYDHFDRSEQRKDEYTKCPLWAKDSDKFVIQKRQAIVEADPEFQKNGARRVELRQMALVELLKLCRGRGYIGFPLYNINDLAEFIIAKEAE